MKYLANKFFSYNPYHDLESLVWMAIDFVILRASSSIVQGQPRQELAALLDPLTEYAGEVLVSKVRGTQSRRTLFKRGAAAAKLAAMLLTTHGPDSPIPTTIAHLIELVRSAMATVENEVLYNKRDRYKPNFASHARFPLSLFKGSIYAEMQSTFLKVSQYYSTTGEKLVKFCDIDRPSEAGTNVASEAPEPSSSTDGRSKRKADENPTSAAPPQTKRSRPVQPSPADL
ncbi:hypothetical protein GGF50DRAFT_121765 [Schizophyllum commune]